MKIDRVRVVSFISPVEFETHLNDVVYNLQDSGYEIEIQYSYNGRYTAIIIARDKGGKENGWNMSGKL